MKYNSVRLNPDSVVEAIHVETDGAASGLGRVFQIADDRSTAPSA